ncbi:ATP-dependent RNA helicase DDX54-like [Littorina saxatilis]|uniref:RNA helicase n=1 Tax=Littorina saxatilis TaxID=31220 RepID=A0AAN9ARS8_9CAEN
MPLSEESDGGSSGGETEMRRLKQAQNRKKKKSGGFQAMGLSHAVFKAITRKGYKLPTPIQRKTIPIIMEGKDVVAMARTGSGKTAAFLVPMLERLKAHSSKGARALVLSPTRELALQTLKFTKELGKFTDLRAAVILGGDKMEDQFSALHQNPDVIIATPGRLLHILVEMNKNLREVIYVVFDEADRLFEMGFAEQLKEILHRVPESRQTLLFSATLPNTLVAFAKAGLSDPTLIRLDVDTKLSTQLKLSFLSCLADDKEAVLLHLLRNVISERELTVVFAATKHHVEYLQTLLTQCGISCTYIYSSLDQTARKIHVAKFQHKQVKVMIVTDLAARGIDIPQLDNVINFNFPAKAKLFVHRVGRVARAGRSGTAYSLLSSDELGHLVDLHVFLGRSLKTVPKGAGQLEDEDGYFGLIPRSVINDQLDELRLVNSESVDVQNQKGVSLNAYKQYLKSRPAAASESIKRAKQLEKELGTLGFHPLFNKAPGTEEDFQQHVLSVLRNYKSKATIFEINATAKKTSHSVMRAKRGLHDHIIKRAQETKSSPAFGQPMNEDDDEEEAEASSAKRLKGVDPETEASEETILSVFKKKSTQQDQVRKKKRKNKVRTPDKKKEKKPRSLKDTENYVAYQPANVNTEAGYKVDNGFKNEISSAVLDFTGDDASNMRSLNHGRKWDRKKKKFVTESNEGKAKKVQTESGNWIPASYKSNIYKTWVRREKTDDNDADSDDDNNSGNRQPKKGRGQGIEIIGTRGKNRHTKGSEQPGSQVGGNKRRFKPNSRELKSKDKILKDRRLKAKKQAFQKHRQVVRTKKQANKKKK